MERHLTTLLCARYSTEVCYHTSSPHGNVRTTEVCGMGMEDLQNHTLYRGLRCSELRYSESIFNGVDAVSVQTVSNRT